MSIEHLLSTHIPENINGVYEGEWAGTSTNVLLVLETLTGATVSVSYKKNRYTLLHVVCFIYLAKFVSTTAVKTFKLLFKRMHTAAHMEQRGAL
jgi:hypothetical protein